MKKIFLILLIAIFVYSCDSNKSSDKKRSDLDKQKAIENFITQGDVSYNNHDFDKAVEYYNKAIKIDSKNDIAIYKAAQAYAQEFKTKKAIKLLSKSIKLNPNNPDYYFFKGKVLILDKKFKEAINNFDKVLEIKPDNIEALLQKAYCYYFQLNYDKSLEIIELIINQTNTFAEVFYLKGLINLDLEKKEQACTDFHTAQNLGYEVEQFLIVQACN